ncbi:MAG: 6-bladed beta-propeller [Bacteroidales bacterium]|nr:6-bladed beta-propeller [Bacteroidales bacterium]
MKLLHNFIIVASSLIMLSCNNNKHIIFTPDKILEVRFGESVNTPFRTSQMIDTVIYVPLDSTCVLGKIDDIKIVNDKYYIIDKTSGRICVFSSSGNHIMTFSKKGHAHDEYITMADVDIAFNGDIHIYDSATRQILKYSDDGTYKSSVNINVFPEDFIVLDNGNYLFYTPVFHDETSCRGLWVSNENGEFIRQLATISDKFIFSGALGSRYFCKIGDDKYGLLGSEENSNIYTITKDSIYSTYRVNHGYSIPADIQERRVVDFKEDIGRLFIHLDYAESARWISYSATNLKNDLRYIYDKKQLVGYEISSYEDFWDDMFIGGVDLFIDGKVVSYLEPHAVLAVPPMHEKFPWINENSNPILAIGKLKD